MVGTQGRFEQSNRGHFLEEERQHSKEMTGLIPIYKDTILPSIQQKAELQISLPSLFLTLSSDH